MLVISVALSVFVTQLVTSGILFSIAVNAELATKPLILGNLPSISATVALKFVFLTKLLTSGIFLSNLLILSSKSNPFFHICFFNKICTINIINL